MGYLIQTDNGIYSIYNVREAGDPDAHDTSTGSWFYQPVDCDPLVVWSEGFPTSRAAERAAREEAADRAIEEAFLKEERKRQLAIEQAINEQLNAQ